MWRRWSMGVVVAIAVAVAVALPGQQFSRPEARAAWTPTQITLAFDDSVSLRLEHGELVITLRI